MNRACVFFFTWLLAGACAAAHQSESFIAVYDHATRVQQVEYKENLVVQIAGFANTPFVIEFSRDEPIGDVALPAGASFEIVKKDFRLFVRPITPPREPVTVLVTTKTRAYVLDLVAGKPADFEDRVSKIIFSYPAPVPAAPAMQLAALAPPKEPPSPALSGYRNDNYSLQVVAETVDIRPREAYDDGRFTYFKFPNNIEIPAIYRSTPGSDEEWLVNSHRDGDYVVMHAVSPLWNFRLSGTVLGIFNDSYEPDGVPTNSGTTVVGLERAVK